MKEKIDDFAEWCLSLDSTDQVEGRRDIEQLQRKWAEAEQIFDQTVARMKQDVAESPFGELDESLLLGVDAFEAISIAAKEWSDYFRIYA